MNTTNTNPETGVRFTAIYLNSIEPETAYWLWTQGTNVSEEEAYKEARAEIVRELQGEDPEEDIECEVDRRMEGIEINIDEPYIEGEYEGVKYGISHLGGAPLLWVFHSLHIGKFRLCSPCVPNACDGNSPDEDGYEGYDVPPDWRSES